MANKSWFPPGATAIATSSISADSTDRFPLRRLVRPQHGRRSGAPRGRRRGRQNGDAHRRLPGVNEKEIEVSLVGDQLTIKGEKRSDHDEKKEAEGRTVHRTERSYGAFQRTLTVPYQVDAGQVSAQFRDGVLTNHAAEAARCNRAKARTQD
jgi:hypothetical protein